MLTLSSLKAEALFQPSMIGTEHEGIAHMLHESIKKCDIDVRRDLNTNTVLSGGTTTLPRIEDRLRKVILACQFKYN